MLTKICVLLEIIINKLIALLLSLKVHDLSEIKIWETNWRLLALVGRSLNSKPTQSEVLLQTFCVFAFEIFWNKKNLARFPLWTVAINIVSEQLHQHFFEVLLAIFVFYDKFFQHLRSRSPNRSLLYEPSSVRVDSTESWAVFSSFQFL